MSNLTTYSFHDNAIRTLNSEQNETLFCLADVCRSLDLTTPARTAEQIKEEFGCGELNSYHVTDSLGREQEATFITEPQLYFVMMRSRAKVAREFRQWICNEVLPSIRKTGAYAVSTRKIGEKDGVFEDELRNLDKSSWYAKRIYNLLQGKVDASTTTKVIDVAATAWKQGYAVACDRHEKELQLAHKDTKYYHDLAEKVAIMVCNVQKNAAKERQAAEEYRAKLIKTTSEYAVLGAEAFKLLALPA